VRLVHKFTYHIETVNDKRLLGVEGFDERGKLLCKNFQGEEKNWSLYTYNNNLYISQWLYPHHQVLKVEDMNDLNQCNMYTSKNSTIFHTIQKFYKKSVLFSLSTPAIPYYGLRLAVGHVKIMGDRVPKNTVAYDFVQNDLYKQPAENTSYMMFFYTFDPSTLDIVRISPGFYPPDIKHGVVFASGLTQHNDDYIISYGEGDYKMKFLFVNSYAIDKLLWPIWYYDEQYEFMYL
jgi:hypothetical protein